MKPTRVYWENLKAYNEGYRVISNRGSSRSGKTYGLMELATTICYRQEKKISVCSRTLPHLKAGCVDQLEQILRSAGEKVEDVHYINDKRFKFGKGKIQYFGADDLDRVYGPEQDILILNEIPFIDFEIFNNLKIRTTGTIFVDYNPFKKFWITEKGIEDEPTTKVITSTFLDNYENLTEAQKDEFERNKQKAESGDTYWQNWWNIYGLGIYSNIKLGSEFIHQFDRSRHVKPCKINPEFPLHFSFDQNVVPYISCLVHQVTKDEAGYTVSVVDEITCSNPYNNTENLCRKIMERYPQMIGCAIYGDATGKRRDTRGRENDYDIIQRMLKRYMNNSSMRVPGGNPSVTKSRDFINKIYAGGFAIKIEISPECHLFLDDLENVKEDADGGMLKEVFRDKFTGQSYEKYGHLLDAHRYFLTEIFKGYFIN